MKSSLTVLIMLALFATVSYGGEKVGVKSSMIQLKKLAGDLKKAVSTTNYNAAIKPLDKMAKIFVSLTNANPKMGDKAVWDEIQLSAASAALDASASAKASDFTSFDSNVNRIWGAMKEGHEAFIKKK